MRKRIVGAVRSEPVSAEGWLNLDRIAAVEVTSEDPDFPIESVFRGGNEGWRAREPGEQRIRLIFDRPIAVNLIRLRFVENETVRTQEFTLEWSSVPNGPLKEIVRQQWNFSPTGSTSEVEEYQTQLNEVAVLELTIRPNLEGRGVRATLAEWRIA